MLLPAKVLGELRDLRTFRAFFEPLSMNLCLFTGACERDVAALLSCVLGNDQVRGVGGGHEPVGVKVLILGGVEGCP